MRHRRTRPTPLQAAHNRLGEEPATITLAQARRDITALGLRIKPTGWNDYRVYHPHEQRADLGYFTDDLADAIATARAIHAARSNRR